LPPDEDGSDQFPINFPQHFIKTFTAKGDKVFDPFMGLGTTAFAAEKLGRVPFGIEADGSRFEWTAGQLVHWQNIRHCDAGDAAKMGWPKMDFCVTSPPFMPISDKWNPLTGGDPKYAGYGAYLKRMEEIFAGVAALMKKNALVVVHAENIPPQSARGAFTPLVRDLSLAISKSLRPEGDIMIDWQGAARGTAPSHALVFKKT
jgi:hypothetical protein